MTIADLRQIGFPSRVTKPKLAQLLEDRYPSYTWEKLYLLKGRLGEQKRLEKTVRDIFPVCICFILCCLYLFLSDF